MYLGELTTPELLDQARRDSANNFFLVGNGARFTFAQTYEEVVRIAAGLEVLGIARGSRILIVLNARVEYPLLLFAAHSLGALCININPAYSRDETAFICEDCNPTLVISEMDFLGDVEAACAGRKLLILGLDRSRENAFQPPNFSHRPLPLLHERANRASPRIQGHSIKYIEWHTNRLLLKSVKVDLRFRTQ